MNLYELKENYLKVLDLIESGEEGLEDTLESIHDAIEVKAENYAKIIKTLDGNVDILKAEIDRLNSRKKSYENNIDRLKENLKQAMIETDKLKIKTNLFNISVSPNLPALNVIDEGKLPNKYFKIEIAKTLEKAILKEDLKNGQVIDGAELTVGKGLRIK